MATHIPYRPWCPSCVSGRGKHDAHKNTHGNKDMQVPVVATGLDGVAQEVPLKAVENKPVERASDYRKLDRPTIMRNQQAAAAREAVAAAPVVEDKDMEYLDIPAFLRRQAD